MVFAFFIFVSFLFFSLLFMVTALAGVGLAVEAVNVRDGDAFGGGALVEATLTVDAGEAPAALVDAVAAAGAGFVSEAVPSVGVLDLAALVGGAESATTVVADMEAASDPVVVALTAYLTAAAEGMGEGEDDVVEDPSDPKEVTEVEATV